MPRAYARLAAALYLAAALCASAHAVPHYSVTALGYAAVYSSLHLNNSGQVAWSSSVWQSGVTTNLGSDTTAYAVSDSGAVVGTSGGAPSHAFQWKNGTMTSMQDADFYNTAMDIAQSGVLVGYCKDRWTSSYRGVVWQNGAYSILTPFAPGAGAQAFAVNDNGQIVGVSNGHAVMWTNGVISDVGFSYYPTDINNSGQVVGNSSGGWGAFEWRAGQMTRLPGLGGSNGNEAYAINDSGVIVGLSWGTAAVWENGSVYDLGTLIPPGLGWDLRGATDINDKGQIVGYGFLNRTYQGFLLTPVPEPSSFLAVLCGLAGTAAVIRRSQVGKPPRRNTRHEA